MILSCNCIFKTLLSHTRTYTHESSYQLHILAELSKNDALFPLQFKRHQTITLHQMGHVTKNTFPSETEGGRGGGRGEGEVHHSYAQSPTLSRTPTTISTYPPPHTHTYAADATHMLQMPAGHMFSNNGAQTHTPPTHTYLAYGDPHTPTQRTPQTSHTLHTLHLQPQIHTRRKSYKLCIFLARTNK